MCIALQALTQLTAPGNPSEMKIFQIFTQCFLFGNGAVSALGLNVTSRSKLSLYTSTLHLNTNGWAYSLQESHP